MTAKGVAFDVVVQVFVRIERGCIRWKEEKIDPVGTAGNPISHFYGSVDGVPIQNQIHLPIGVPDKTTKKLCHALFQVWIDILETPEAFEASVIVLPSFKALVTLNLSSSLASEEILLASFSVMHPFLDFLGPRSKHFRPG